MLVVLGAAACFVPAAAEASTVTYGPLTFGSNEPLGSGNFVPLGGSNYVVELDHGAPVSVSAIGTTCLSNQTTTFSFDLASGWAIAGMSLGGTVDYSYPGSAPFSAWGYQFGQQVTLCSTDDVCSTTQKILEVGGADNPGVSLGATAGAGSSVYQEIEYADNADIFSDALPSLNIYLTQVSPTPEPSTFAMLGTGLLGFAGVVGWRRMGRAKGAIPE